SSRRKGGRRNQQQLEKIVYRVDEGIQSREGAKSGWSRKSAATGGRRMADRTEPSSLTFLSVSLSLDCSASTEWAAPARSQRKQKLIKELFALPNTQFHEEMSTSRLFPKTEGSPKQGSPFFIEMSPLAQAEVLVRLRIEQLLYFHIIPI